MYKLVAVGGKLRGQEFVLEEGPNQLGRSPDSTVSLQLEGISKKHVSITVNGDTAFVEDLGSSNGTFINGKLVKQVTVKNGDKLALPNVIFQIVYVKEKKVIVKRKVASSEGGDGTIKESVPKDLPGKIKYYFKNKVMSVIYSFNEQYEWRVLLGIVIFAFIVTNIIIIVGPVVSDSRSLLIREIAKRGEQYASEVARFNAAPLSRGDLDKINTTFLESDADGVVSYELFGLEGVVVRPISKLNTHVSDTFALQAWKHFKGEQNANQTFIRSLGDNEIGIAKAILAYHVQTGRSEPVGIIAIRFKPQSLEAEAANNAAAYFESLIIASLVGIVFFGVLYYMTYRPLEEMKIQIEDVLRGKRRELESKLLMDEIHPLRSTINSVLQKIKELQNDTDAGFQEVEEDGSYIRVLYEFMQGAQGPVMILNSEKAIAHLNAEAEDLTGMRESSAEGTSLLDSARDQGFAATVIDLCDQCANNEGSNQSEIYELTGKNYMVHVSSLIGKDNFAKAFYITFVLDE